MRFGPPASRPFRWIAIPGSAILLLLFVFTAACAEEQPPPPPQQPALPAEAPTAVPIDTAPQTTRVAPLPAPTASLPPPTVAPTSAPTTPTPAPRPTRNPSTAAPTPVPTETAAQPTVTQPEMDSVAIVWGDVFKQLSTAEQDCLDAELGKDQLQDIGAKPVSPEQPQWAPAVIGCLAPDTATAFPGAMMFSLMVNEMLLGDAGQGEVPPEARECIQELLADTDIGAVIAAALQDPAAGQVPNQAVMDFAMGIEMCAPPSTGMMGPPPGEHPELPIEATLWQFSVPGWAMNAPTVSHGMAYVGADDGNVYALDAANGGPVWTFETGDVVRSPAVVSDN
ncbi:MAG: PQQ-binding-like beta-propeller repeat protein [Dehalococcoidia bacterium]|nr:PQQ-binding-like beta-propeller repeat protein [Dehalococcoidia bacterium]